MLKVGKVCITLVTSSSSETPVEISFLIALVTTMVSFCIDGFTSSLASMRSSVIAAPRFHCNGWTCQFYELHAPRLKSAMRVVHSTAAIDAVY